MTREDQKELNKALYRAAQQGNVHEIDRLLAQGADPEAPNGKFPPAFYAAILSRQPAAVQRFVQAGVDLNQRFSNDLTPLMAAAFEGDAESARILLDAGVALEPKMKIDGSTALMLAVKECHPEAVELLLARGADANARGDWGWTCILVAVGGSDQAARADMVRALLAHGADINAQMDDGYTALHIAAGAGALQLVRLLLEYGAKVELSPPGLSVIDVVELEMNRQYVSMDPQVGQPILDLLRAHGAKRWAEMTPEEQRASRPKKRRAKTEGGKPPARRKK